MSDFQTFTYHLSKFVISLNHNYIKTAGIQSNLKLIHLCNTGFFFYLYENTNTILYHLLYYIQHPQYS